MNRTVASRLYPDEMCSHRRSPAGAEETSTPLVGQLVRRHWESGTLHKNAWFHDWLVDHEIPDESGVYKATKDPTLLRDLINRAEAQQTQPVEIPEGRGIVAGRALDLTKYLSCGHPDCVTLQVDRLFSRVWHYFDNIAVVGPDAHVFLEEVSRNGVNSDSLARGTASNSRPIFHIRDIGADSLVTWIAKPPSCPFHWKDFQALKDLEYPAEELRSVASVLLKEGTIKLEKSGQSSRFILQHRLLFGGQMGLEQHDVLRQRKRRESVESTVARIIAEQHWAGAAADLYAARSMGLPLGFGVGLEAALAAGRRTAITPAEVAFNLQLPVVDGLPISELIALRQSEYDAFENFRDSLTRAIKAKLATVEAGEKVDQIASEIKEDEIDPALHKIRQRLNSAEGILRKNHRYNIALAGLSTTCGLIGAPSGLAISLGVAALTGAAAVEAKLGSDKKDVSLEGMYFLWQAKEYAEKKQRSANKSKGRRKR